MELVAKYLENNKFKISDIFKSPPMDTPQEGDADHQTIRIEHHDPSFAFGPLIHQFQMLSVRVSIERPEIVSMHSSGLSYSNRTTHMMAEIEAHTEDIDLRFFIQIASKEVKVFIQGREYKGMLQAIQVDDYNQTINLSMQLIL